MGKALILILFSLFAGHYAFADAVSEDGSEPEAAITPEEGEAAVDEDIAIDPMLDLCIKEVLSKYLGDEEAGLEDKPVAELQALSNKIVQAIIDTCPCETDEAFVLEEILSDEIQALSEEQAVADEGKAAGEEVMVGEQALLDEGVPAVAIEGHCACEANTVLTMIDIGIPFDLAFNSVTEVCGLEGAELGELARSLAPSTTGTASGGGPSIGGAGVGGPGPGPGPGPGTPVSP